MNNLIVKKNDTVVVLSGKDKGKRGKVMSVEPKDSKVVVEKVNIVSRHTKPRKQGEEGGIIKKEAPLHVSKVMRVCPKCSKPTRYAAVIHADGKRVRVCKNCGAEI
jgi:large subunit ribosomal protein L24